ncbi:MAG: hypothetical protein LKK00_09555 [Intestinimonas sp.]|nr:hypothetical protein [Intestinimonas sp.]
MQKALSLYRWAVLFFPSFALFFMIYFRLVPTAKPYFGKKLRFCFLAGKYADFLLSGGTSWYNQLGGENRPTT